MIRAFVSLFVTTVVIGSIVVGATKQLNNVFPETLVSDRSITISQLLFEDVKFFSPENGANVNHNFIVEGQARGFWFFEGVTTIDIFTILGDRVGGGIASAHGDWMTESFVPFTAEIMVDADYTGSANVVFHKSNPSSLNVNDDEVSYTVIVVHESNRTAGAYDSCVITGCSGTVCANEPVITTCEWLDHYACYADGVCEQQADSQCGWTRTPDLIQCLSVFVEPPT